MKKLLSILFILVIFATLTACNKKPAEKSWIKMDTPEVVDIGIETSSDNQPAVEEPVSEPVVEVIEKQVTIEPEKTEPEPGNYDAFANCLTEKGFKMYGSDWCGHCNNQKNMFGPSFAKVNYINCEFKKEECQQAGITGYPTWVFGNGEKSPGAKPLSFLAEVSGCEL